MIRLLRVLWIIFQHRHTIERSEKEAKILQNEQIGMLSEFTGDDVDEVTEGIFTLGRLSELFTMNPKHLKRELNYLKGLFDLYDKRH